MLSVPARLEDVVSEVVATIGSGVQIAPFTARPEGLSVEDAYRVSAMANRRREEGGEIAVGRKIGFTNRTLWERYNVHAPIWGYMYASTVHELSASGSCSIAAFAEPRIEPEIVFGIAEAPEPWMTDEELFSCIGWIAHGFEIVQTIYPGWQFAAADTIAANGLHGALYIGERHQAVTKPADWQRALADFRITLCCDGRPVVHGHSANVLGGPVSALGHLVRLLDQDHISLQKRLIGY